MLKTLMTCHLVLIFLLPASPGEHWQYDIIFPFPVKVYRKKTSFHPDYPIYTSLTCVLDPSSFRMNALKDIFPSQSSISVSAFRMCGEVTISRASSGVNHPASRASSDGPGVPLT